MAPLAPPPTTRTCRPLIARHPCRGQASETSSIRQGAAPASRRMSARLVSSSTPVIAFRTSSISRRTAQTVSSGTVGAGDVRRPAGAGDRRQRPLEHAERMPDLHLVRGALQPVAAAAALLGAHEAGAAQLAQDRVEELLRDRVLPGDLARNRPFAGTEPRQVDERLQAVLAPHRQHGNTLELRARACAVGISRGARAAPSADVDPSSCLPSGDRAAASGRDLVAGLGMQARGSGRRSRRRSAPSLRRRRGSRRRPRSPPPPCMSWAKPDRGDGQRHAEHHRRLLEHARQRRGGAALAGADVGEGEGVERGELQRARRAGREEEREERAAARGPRG